MSPSRRRAIGAVRGFASRSFWCNPLITRAARWGHRALPPLHPRNSPALPLAAPRGAVPWCGPVAVGRDVPIAPPRLARCAAWPPVLPLAKPRGAVPWCGPVAVGRDGRPPRHRRGAWFASRAPPVPRCRAIPRAAWRLGAMVGRRARGGSPLARGGSPPRCAAWLPHRHACGGSPPTRLTARLRRQSRRQAESKCPHFQTPGHSRAKHGTTR